MSRIHPITHMVLEDGHGAADDTTQALLIHCAYIEQTQGKEAADTMREKVRAAVEPPVDPAPEPEPEPEPTDPVVPEIDDVDPLPLPEPEPGPVEDPDAGEQ